MDSESLAVIKDHLLNPLMALSGCLIDRLGDNPGYIPALQKVRFTFTRSTQSETERRDDAYRK
jgi:hypothetical protein